MANMMHLSGINLAFKVFELLINRGIIMLMDLGDQILAKGQNGTSSQIDQFHLFRHIFAYFKIGLDLSCFRK